MLRPYRHWLVKDILDRRLGTLAQEGTYLLFHELSHSDCALTNLCESFGIYVKSPT